MSRILEINGLKTQFETRNGTVRAVDGVDISIDRGDTLGIVGESGCGKTVLALSVMRLISYPPGRIVSGQINFKGTDLLTLDETDMQKLRGNDISMIFQEPMNSLNPVLKVGDQISEVIQLHEGLSKKEALDRACDMLRLVGIPSARNRLNDYPHQMSGGMRQRVMIAMALACTPALMLADEPTTALDVTIQAQILDLINKLKDEVGTSVMLITHDLGIVAETARNAAVMYTGKVVEYCSVLELFSTPLHPYTRGLLESTPKQVSEENGYLKTIPGTVPNLYELPAGCSFRNRCPDVMEICARQEPQLIEKSPGHQVRCWKYA
ncbi:MAG TPA: ABC transporter ATP-binding protein [Syntrophales bacterium]|nr:ABC transporter ATP-binding protein [Syntrophales bacterium]HPQ44813.1 ABC transporter ATP-binding protein [Syntrophales bacterium]